MWGRRWVAVCLDLRLSYQTPHIRSLPTHLPSSTHTHTHTHTAPRSTTSNAAKAVHNIARNVRRAPWLARSAFERHREWGLLPALLALLHHPELSSAAPAACALRALVQPFEWEPNGAGVGEVDCGPTYKLVGRCCCATRASQRRWRRRSRRSARSFPKSAVMAGRRRRRSWT